MDMDNRVWIDWGSRGVGRAGESNGKIGATVTTTINKRKNIIK